MCKSDRIALAVVARIAAQVSEYARQRQRARMNAALKSFATANVDSPELGLSKTLDRFTITKCVVELSTPTFRLQVLCTCEVFVGILGGGSGGGRWE
jgi:hypothetical protein